MSDARTNRKLAAILAADVVGYSRLMAADEVGTLAALKKHRETVFDPAIARHSGRIVKLIGDGTLVEFGSVVDAVSCAIAIQTVKAASDARPMITLRIGINLGDIIIEGDDIYGDGVNIAARLEPLAEPGGISISSIVNESVGNRIDAVFTDGGEVKVKNIDRPIRVWKWSPVNNGSPVVSSAVVGTPKSETPSIAVLPFANMSGDAEQEYFSDGMSDDIITDLSKVGGLLVIARNSSFAYKGKSVDVRTVANELRVRAVLEGSIRRSGNRVRITAQLIDAVTGGHLWAERYDRDITDIFAVQDEVTREIVTALKVKLTPREESQLSDTGTKSLEAHDCFLRGRGIMEEGLFTRDDFAKASALFERAIAIDPNYVEPYVELGFAYVLAFDNNWVAHSPATLQRAEELAVQAVRLAPDNPNSHFVLSVVARTAKDLPRSRAAVERALLLNPNHSRALYVRGGNEIFAGNPAAAIPFIERAMRINPNADRHHLQFLGLAHFLVANYETAATIFKERIVLSPQTDVGRVMLAAALGQLGEADEAQRIWRELMEINPKYSLREHLQRLFGDTDGGKTITEGLAKVGLPD